MRLNDEEFSHVISQLLAQESLPHLDKIINAMMQEENHKTVIIQRDCMVETAITFSTNVPKTTHALEMPTCKHCRRIRHEEANYFEMIGYLNSGLREEVNAEQVVDTNKQAMVDVDL